MVAQSRCTRSRINGQIYQRTKQNVDSEEADQSQNIIDLVFDVYFVVGLKNLDCLTLQKP